VPPRPIGSGGKRSPPVPTNSTKKAQQRQPFVRAERTKSVKNGEAKNWQVAADRFTCGAQVTSHKMRNNEQKVAPARHGR